MGKHFGDVTKQPAKNVKIGSVVSAIFRTANPRNNLRTEDTFLTVEIQQGSDWKVVATDGDWSTKFKWSRPSKISSESNALIEWNTTDATPGTYRIRHFNAHKSILGKITEFSGTSHSFSVAA